MKKIFLKFLSIILVCCDCKRTTVFVYKPPDVKFNINYINVSWDIAAFEKGTKEKPVEMFPKLTVWILTDLNRLQFKTKVVELKTKNILLEQRINLCSSRSITGMFVRPFLERILESSNVKVGCPYKKGLVINVEPFKFDGIIFSSIFQTYSERTNTIVVTEGKNATPIFSVIIHYHKIEVDD
ncbi:hypothetical protein PVAND_015637 [Polypedilum vanderplanki]|uniref:Uncharacterized protein n=1 Tax=Polypedilum vanderplanki TaxID=319348 RepID=A0A9J6BDK2_POLVA|nr:hypothetical protein PVAND_015637 [Polypedilum vanderplanki]